MQNSIVIPKSDRIVSIDVLRGLVMIIMALDHVRDFFHFSAGIYDPLDLKYTTVPIFLTRWVTHFCAPVFVFLSGTSAYLTLKRKEKKGLSKFLFTRGLWLVVAEITLINFGWDFFQVFSIVILQVIWALGISMIALSVFVYLHRSLLLIIALIIIAGHNAIDNVYVKGDNALAFVWSILHNPGLFVFGSFRLFVAYPVLPWIGVMSAGYCFGQLYADYPSAKRKKTLAAIGILCIIVFVVLRFSNIYGDNGHWSQQKNAIFTLLSFINTAKYPPSLLFILMTLGPAILFLALVGRPLNKITNIIAVYGRVPMFYYILHIYFIHVAFIITGLITGYTLSQLFASNILERSHGFGFRLWAVYIIWIALVAFLYPLCKWYDAYKIANRQKWWLSYL